MVLFATKKSLNTVNVPRLYKVLTTNTDPKSHYNVI